MAIQRWLPPAMLAGYSATLLGFELGSSQARVRPYFSDIEGDVLFFAINTTLSAGFLAGAALVMLFAAAIGRGEAVERRLLLSQAAMFAALAADDRFQLHERIGWRIGIGDHFVLLAWAAVELVLLALLFRPLRQTLRACVCLLAGGILFSLMLVIDAVVPADAPMRLSFEDLAKTWGTALLFVFGWDVARFHISGLLAGERVGPRLRPLS
ncbi:MAG: hypothetical protein ACT4OE_00280 [Sphingosinicella sp.]